MMDYNAEQREKLEKRKEEEHNKAKEKLLEEGKSEEVQTVYQRTFKYTWDDNSVVKNTDLNEVPIRKAEKVQL